MKKELKSIAMQLSENDIKELFRLKKMGDKRVIALRKEREKMAANLARLDKRIARLMGEDEGEKAEAPKRRRRSRKSGRRVAAKKAKAEPKKARGRPGRKAGKVSQTKSRGTRGKGRKSARINNLSAAVRKVIAKAGAPLKASQVVDGLPGAGIKVASVADMRKRVSVVLASQKKHFDRVEPGLYQLKD